MRVLASELPGATVAQLVRFALSGGLATILYAVVAIGLARATELDAIAVHVLAYFICIPMSYLLQRGYTFRHTGSRAVSGLRFLVVATTAFLASTVAVILAEMAELPPNAGTLAVIVIVPTTSYLMMRMWVFRQEENGQRDD